MKKTVYAISPETLLSLAAAIIDKEGYRKTSVANSTADAVRAIAAKTTADIETAESKAITEWVSREYTKRPYGYMESLKDCLNHEKGEGWMVGYLASAVDSYRRDMAKRAEWAAAEAAEPKGAFLGKEGDKVTFTIATVKAIADATTFHNTYRGPMEDWADTLRIETTNGEVVIWRCRGAFLQKAGLDSYEEMVGMTFAAKVKQTNAFRGVNQTRVWYCKAI